MFKKKRSVKIESAKSKIESAFNMFVKANEGIDKANSVLEEVKANGIEEKNRLLAQISEIEQEVELAETGIKDNNQLKEKIQSFIP